MSLLRNAGVLNSSLLIRNNDDVQPYWYSVLTRLEPEECRWPRSRLRSQAEIGDDVPNMAPQVWDWQVFVYSAGYSGRMPIISGVTTDSSGGIVGNALVKLYDTATDALVDPGVRSDPTTGVYVATNPATNPCYAVAYKTGSPDIAGTTVDTLTPV